MKYLALLLFVLLVCPCSAQSIEKRYRSSICENGILYFFRPVKLKKVENIKGFVYDMTYVSKADSVTVNFTIDIKNPLNVLQVELQTDKQKTTNGTPKLLYRDVLKSSYEARVSVVIPYKEIETLFQSETPLSFLITLSNGSVGKATYSKSKWKKENRNISRLFQSIQL